MQTDLESLKQDIVFETHLHSFHFTFCSTWGLFSPKGIDAGTRLLIEHLEVGESDVCMDLGCGYGPIGLVMAKLAPKGQTMLIDKDFIAVEYARKNAARNGLDNTETLLSNGFSHVPDLAFDVIASNIPAKAGKELLYLMMAEARHRLQKGGRCYVVTLSGLKPYIKRTFMEIFGNYKKVKQGKTHTVSLGMA
ncbi:MAG: class I SAM-dependent methyltransferase [Candidatus Latescibacteria bacterium]|nr:class I SAM-dependent methyltransferase [Candidatus Latescibacterota bacterium]MCK5526977.1 class I SAM-dependent methyltransferase [Candidatus Latescibacterota bacterium]